MYLLPDEQARSFANEESGIAQLREYLKGRRGKLLAAMEATNVFWKLAATHLHAARLNVAVVNPRQVRDFAKAMGTLGKTDASEVASSVKTDFQGR